MSDQGRGGFEDALRAIARELQDTVERVSEADVEGLARSAGLDPDQARRWTDDAGRWLRDQADQLGGSDPLSHLGDLFRGGGPAPRATADEQAPAGRPPAGRDATGDRDDADPLRGAQPHPLDVPTDDQGAALAALLSGRWTVEPGTSALAAAGDGPAPSDALGLVRELRVRDWLDGDGRVTVVGRHALERWLARAAQR